MIQRAQSALRQIFGHDHFKDHQEEVISHVLGGNSGLMILPTGGGKSLCYQIPALVLPGLCLVVSPLIALMKDQVDRLQQLGVRATFINSSLNRKEREERQRMVAEGAFDLLYVTPERFRKEEFRSLVSKLDVCLLAVDEAHCVSEWGHDFRPDYTRLAEVHALLGTPPVLALTATATPEVQQDIRRQLGFEEKAWTLFHGGVERENLALSVQDVLGEEAKLTHLIEQLKARRGSAIVYFALVKTLDRFSHLLTMKQVEHSVYHGRLPQEKRRRLQDDFMKKPDALVLATNAFGLGVDKAEIGLIVHAEVPGSLESYVQETGRAGRDGLPACCELLYDQNDLLIQMDFVEWANPGQDYLERLLELLHERGREFSGPEGLEALREELVYKDRGDFRLETALNLLDRHGVTSGSLASRNLKVVSPELPDPLNDLDWLISKKKQDLSRLHDLVRYINHPECRRAFLNEAFGFPDSDSCGICDACRRAH